MPVLITVLILVLLIIFASCIKIVPQASALILERLGAYKATWGVGIFVLITSLDVSVSSSSISPMIFRSVVAERFSMAMIGLSTP